MSKERFTKDDVNEPLNEYFQTPVKVVVLLLYWKDSDEPVFKAEAHKLSNLFEQKFGYPVQIYEIPSDDSFFNLICYLAQFLRDCNSPRSLVIIHYGGHGDPDKEGGRRSVWAAQSRNGQGPTVNWSDIQPTLRNSKADFLVILDCCFAAQAARSGHDRNVPANVELLAAAAMGNETPMTAYQSFTGALIEELEKALRCERYAVIRNIHKSLADGAKNLKQTPILIEHGTVHSIRLVPFPRQGAVTNPSTDPEATFTLQMLIRKKLDDKLLRQLITWMTASAPQEVLKIDVKYLAYRGTVNTCFTACLELYRQIQLERSHSWPAVSSYISLEGERFATFEQFLDGTIQDKQLRTSAVSPAESKEIDLQEAGTLQELLLKITEDKLKELVSLIRSYKPTKESKMDTTVASLVPESSSVRRKGASNDRSWSTEDKTRIQNLASDLGRLNDGLTALAPIHIAARLDFDWLKRVFDGGLQGTQWALDACLDHAAYSTLAKKLRLKEHYKSLNSTGTNYLRPSGLDGRRTEIDFKEIGPIGDASKIFQPKLGSRTSALYRLSSFKQTRVLIEWRGPFNTSSGPTAIARLDTLVEVLQEMSHIDHGQDQTHPTFGILRCIGWTRQHNHSLEKLGFIFQAPEHTAHHPVSLYEKLTSGSQSNSQDVPALGARFKLAQVLARIFASVIAVKCLHRGVRSHNILFFPEDGLEKPYLAGFIETRPDENHALSSIIQDDEGQYDHYRPSRNAASQPRNSIDLYGLGVVLLEIGLWRSVGNMQNGAGGLRELHEKVIPKSLRKLSSRVGDCYKHAVETCLNSVNQGSDELDLDYAARILQDLAQCSA